MSDFVPLRTALIGAGAWGRRYIETLKLHADRYDLVAVVSRNPETVNYTSSQCKIFTSIAELIAFRDLDCVIVATPPHLHVELARICCERGIPVLVEKPLCLKLSEAEQLLALQLKMGACVMVNHIFLFHPLYEILRSNIKKVGALKSFVSRGGNRGPVRPDYNSLWDYGPHDLSMVIDLAGEMPEQVTCRTLAREADVGEIYQVDLKFRNGISANCEFGNGMVQKVRELKVTGSEGSAIFSDTPPSLGINGEIYEKTTIAPLWNVLDHFSQVVRGNADRRAGLELACKVTGVLEQCSRQMHFSSL